MSKLAKALGAEVTVITRTDDLSTI